MALSRNRRQAVGETSYPWEREAIDFVLDGLPDVDPYQAWELVELIEPRQGRLYEIDLLVLGRHQLYLIEIKSHPGVLTGDSRDWRFTHEHDGKTWYLENPLLLANRKARVLASMLERKVPREHGVWVEPLVFVSHDALSVRLDESGKSHVVDRGHVHKAITHGEYPGSSVSSGRIVNRPTMRAVAQALHDLGLRPSKASRLVGEYRIGELLAEGPGYQEHLGQHLAIPALKARLRSYLVPRATTVERKAQLERAAQREANVLSGLGEHPLILRCTGYKADAPLGPALLFETFEDGEPLDLFVRRETGLAFDDRLAIIEKVAQALNYCHRKNVLHRNVSPGAVLVRRALTQEAGLEVRLHSFQLAVHEGGLGTKHVAALSDDRSLLYQAPEVLDDPSKATPASDVFSLGALAYFVLSGQDPAPTLVERDAKLQAQDGLRLSAVSDDFSRNVDEIVAFATLYHAARRADAAMEWLGLLLDAATAPPEPAAAAPIRDPHSARPGDELTGGFVVRRDLGSGSTAQVLQVVREGKSYALKIPHDDGCVERLRAEAAILERLDKHDHIVRSHGMVQIGGRECLLLDFAGSDAEDEPQNLADLLRRDGTVVLDYARRFGDDLLSALEHLEEEGVQHRDIKPQNIGFTPSPKKARHLMLFDFSLSNGSSLDVTGGTPAYRDPYLRRRGAWDAAADRYSAAVVLHEVLTGARPALPEGASLPETAASAAIPRVRIEAERFDAALRDRLVRFFEKALAPEAGDRFGAAEEMKTEWLSVFGELSPPQASLAPSRAAAEQPQTAPAPADDLEGVTAATPVEALPLSVMARNALDRAGVATAGEVVLLPRNLLSAVRGVGSSVAIEVYAVADRLRSRLGDQAKAADAFAPEFQGPRLQPVAALGLADRAALRLADAGISTAGDLAAASRERVERLLGQRTAAAAKKQLAALAPADAASAPGTVAGWVARLLPAATRRRTWPAHVRCLFGLDPLPGAADEAVAQAGAGVKVRAPETAEVARAFGVTRQAVSISLSKGRELWAAPERGESLDGLVAAAVAAVDGLGGVAPLAEAAAELARARGAAAGGAVELQRAAALLRLVAELRLEPGGASPLSFGRVHGEAWLATSRGLIETVRRLGAAADELARVEPLPSSERVRATLMHLVEHSPLVGLPAERLVALAARASAGAAASSRLEIYPRGMPAERAVALSAAVLSLGALDPDEVRRRLLARYPEAEPPPERPRLDLLLGGAGIEFDVKTGTYQRKGQALPTTLSSGSSLSLSSRLATAMPHQVVRLTAGALEARRFDEALRAGVERGRFRVLQVNAKSAELAAGLLGEALGVAPTSLDALFWKHLEAARVALEIDPEAVIEADRAGPLARETWELLRSLVRTAAKDTVAELLSHREAPRLLVHPGIFARYDLSLELQDLVERAEHEEGAAVLLLVPSYDDGAPPSINGRLPVPVHQAGQRLRVPRSWLRNEHRAASPEAV